MDDSLLITIAFSGFGVAALHAALPTHWLPFALTSRAQGWSGGKTFWVVLAAASAHVLFTILLGLVVFKGGSELSEATHEIFHSISGGIIVLLGAWFVFRQISGRGHGHTHLLGRHGDEMHDHEYDEHCLDREVEERKRSHLTIGALLLMLTLSPCESFLPIYLTGSSWGWDAFVLLSVVLFVATVGAMTILTLVARAGVERIHIGILEKYENGALGLILVILGTAFFVWGH